MARNVACSTSRGEDKEMEGEEEEEEEGDDEATLGVVTVVVVGVLVVWMDWGGTVTLTAALIWGRQGVYLTK